MNPISPTPHPDVNQILTRLFNHVQDILQDQFIGMYLFGSLANGDFDEHSDIDVLVVTDGDLSENTCSALDEMHTRMAELDSPWAVQQEVSYIPRQALRRYDPANNMHPHLDRDKGQRLHRMAHASDWIIQRYLLREHGLVISGPDLPTLIDPVEPNELRQAVMEVLPIWVSPILEDPAALQRLGYQSYCVLSLCRMLYTLQNKAVLSKRAAAAWGAKTLEARWKPLIEHAVVGRQNPHLEASPEEIEETLAMMRYTLAISTQPSIFPDVNEVLNRLLSSVKQILNDQFVGMYLYGSLASGDFNPATSDIDFLVVTQEILSGEMIAKLEAMHAETWATGLKRASKLEGAYVPIELIRRHNPDGPPCPGINEGTFHLERLGSDWVIQRHVVREYGVVIEGPDPKSLIDSISPEALRAAVRGILHEWWFPMLEEPSWLRDHESPYRAFAVTTMCRVFHALAHGTIVSKPRAIQWARQTLGDPWRQLIDQAAGSASHREVEVPLEETLNFIRFTRGAILKNEAAHK